MGSNQLSKWGWIGESLGDLGFTELAAQAKKLNEALNCEVGKVTEAFRRQYALEPENLKLTYIYKSVANDNGVRDKYGTLVDDIYQCFLRNLTDEIVAYTKKGKTKKHIMEGNQKTKQTKWGWISREIRELGLYELANQAARIDSILADIYGANKITPTWNEEYKEIEAEYQEEYTDKGKLEFIENIAENVSFCVGCYESLFHCPKCLFAQICGKCEGNNNSQYGRFMIAIEKEITLADIRDGIKDKNTKDIKGEDESWMSISS